MKATIFISKTKYGFNKYVNYVLSKAEKSKLIDSNSLVLTSSEIIAQSFINQAKTNPRVKNPAIHLAISFTDEEYYSLKDGKHIVRQYLESMNWFDTQYLVVEHNDNAKHHHYHIVLSKIDNHGTRLPDSFCIMKSNMVCRKMTHTLFGKNTNTWKNHLTTSIDIALEESSNIEKLKETLHMEFIDMTIKDNYVEFFEIGNKKTSVKFNKDEILQKLKVGPVRDFNISIGPQNSIDRITKLLHK